MSRLAKLLSLTLANECINGAAIGAGVAVPLCPYHLCIAWIHLLETQEVKPRAPDA